MRDRSKKLLVINTGKKESEQTRLPAQSGTTHIIGGGGLSVNMSDYLLKSIWDKVFEIRTDSQGKEYIFGKLPVVTQYGITMYSGDGVDVPSLASGLPFDGRTIWYNPETQQIEVIGGTGGGSGEGVSNFWDLSGIPSWITNTKPKYSYSEIEGTPDLSKYALTSQIPSLSGYATESWVTKQNYATKATTLSGYGITDAYTKTNVDDLLKSYVTLGGTQTITGEKNFTGGLKVNGSPIYYDSAKKYWKLEGDLLVTGGVTMYGSDSSFTPSTIMDAILYDDTTLGINSNGQLYVKGGTSGGGLDITALQNYLTQNSYLNVTSGDNRYLKLSGGEISSTSMSPFTINTSYQAIEFQLKSNSSIKAYIGWNVTEGVFLQEGESTAYIGVRPNKTPYYFNGTRYTLWHEGNFTPSNYLPLSGGTITSVSWLPLEINSTDSSESVAIKLSTNGVRRGGITYNTNGLQIYNEKNGHYISVTDEGIPKFTNFTIWHSGNDGSGSGLDADLLDGLEGSWHRQNVISFGRVNYTSSLVHDANVAIDGMLYNYGSNTYWRNTPDMSYGQILTLKSYGNNNLMGQLAWDIRHGESDTTRYLWWRAIQNESTISNAKWHQIAFTDSNVASATYSPNTSKLYSTDNIYSYGSANPYYGYLTFNQTYGEWDFKVSPSTPQYIHVYSSDKLRTTRTIWGQSFDGTGNVSGTISDLSVIVFDTSNGASNIGYLWTNTRGMHMDMSGLGTEQQGTNLTLTPFGNVGIGTASPGYKLDVRESTNTSYGIHYYNSSNKCGFFVGGSALWYGNSNTGNGMLMRIQSGVVTDGSGGSVALDLTANGNLLVSGGITMYSDQRKKTILNHVELSLNQIANAPLIEHYYNSDESKTTHVGSIAQYWASINDWFCKLDSEGFYTMEIQNAALASAISIARELDRYETKTDKAIKKLKKRICELEEEVERLKSA